MDPRLEQQLKQSYGVTNLPPLVTFFDHAIEDPELTRQSGRPRFNDVTYIEKKPRGSNTGDVFHSLATDEHRLEFPKQWAAYMEKRGELANRAPSLKAMPGMTEAKYKELLALGLRDCEQLMNYEGNLDDLAPFRSIARKIMEISNDLREGRNAVGTEAGGQVHADSGLSGAIGIAGVFPMPIGYQVGQPVQAQSNEGRKVSNAPVTFEYSF